MNFIKDYNKTAIIFDGKYISYKEVIARSKYFSTLFDIKIQEKIIIFMENRPELLYSFLGVWDRRGTCVCLDASFSGEELVYYLNDSDARYIYTSNGSLKAVKDAIALSGKTDIEVINVDEVEIKDIEIDEYVLKAPEKEDIVLMLYTSGTTGAPKGVMLKFDNILVNIEGLDNYKMFIPEDIVLALLPMHHIFPLLGAGVIPLYEGSTIVFLKELSSQTMVDAFKEYKVTMMIGVPRLWEMLHKKIMEKINSSKIIRGVFKLAEKIDSMAIRKKIFKRVHEEFGGNVRFFVSGGSKLDPQISKDFLTLGIQVCEGYGMTETSPMITFTPINEIVPGSAGKVLPGVEVKISGEGEIWARGRNVMAGYYKKPEATAETVDSEGWIHTGDLGEMRGEYLFVTGRKKEMIVLSNGKNINPVEIEQWIMANTNLIQEMAVAEVDSVLTAIVYPNFQKIIEEKITNIKETLKWGVIDKYNGKAPKYKKILDIRIVQEELPKTKLGKVRRFMLHSLLQKKEDENVVIEEPTFDEYKEIKNYLEKIKNKKITPMAHLELDLGLDSLDMVELLTYLEANYGIKGEESIIVNNPTVEKLAKYIQENRGEGRFEEINWKEYLNKAGKINLPTSNIAIHIIRAILWLPLTMYIRVKKSGVKNIPDDRPVIFAGNHQSFLDAFVFAYATPFKFLVKSYSLAKIKHFNKRYMKFLANHSNVVLMDINKNLGEVLQTMAKVLKDGKNVVIFPEGARTRDGHMLEFKKSFAILAKEIGVDIVPFGIRGAFEAFPSTSKLPKPSQVEIRYFKPISPEGKNYEDIVKETRDTLIEWVEK